MTPDRAERGRQYRSAPVSRDNMSVLLGQLEDLAQHLPAIEALASNAVEQNVFYEPLLLIPALEQYGPDTEPRFLLIFCDEGDAEGPLMCGFLPLQERTQFRGLPCLHLAAFRYPHCYLSTPLLHRDYLADSLTALIEWLRYQEHYKLLDLPQITSEGVFINTLERLLEQHGIASTTYTYVRTAFTPDTDADLYLQRILSPRMRRSLRRKVRKLTQIGAVDYTMLTSAAELESWTEDFLRLEAAGWKGRYGTALSLTAPDRKFFRAIVSRAFEVRRLVMLSLRLNSRPIAMLVNFEAGNGSYAFKVAFDEKYRRYSPGVLLDLELIRILHRSPKMQWMDLCTDEGNNRFSRLFDRNKSIRNLTISNGQLLGDLAVHMLPILKRMKHTWHSVKPKETKGP